MVAITLLTTAGLLNANSAFQNMIDLKGIILKHKIEWLKWEGETHKQKYDLIAKNLEQMEKYIAQNTAKFEKLFGEHNDELIAQQTQDVLDLHKKNMTAMHDFWQKKHQEAQQLYEKQEAELAKFQIAGKVENIKGTISPKIKMLQEKLSRAWNINNK
jgi:hypothetical protein